MRLERLLVAQPSSLRAITMRLLLIFVAIGLAAAIEQLKGDPDEVRICIFKSKRQNVTDNVDIGAT